MSAAKDLHRLMRNIDSRTAGQASVGGVDWEDGQVTSFKVAVKPNSGFFKGGTFEFEIYLGQNYPSTTPPVVRCLTDILHPNIDSCDGYDSNSSSPTNVCINLLHEGTWDPKFGLESIVLGLLFLLSNPNFESPLSEFFEENYEENEENFSEMVYHYMRGKAVSGNYFDAQFFSNVEGQADMPYGGNSATDCAPTGNDVTPMSATGSTEECTPVSTLTAQITLTKTVSLTKQASLTKQVSLIRQPSLKKQLSTLSSSQGHSDTIPGAGMDPDSHDMKLINIDNEMVLVNNYEHKELVSDSQ